MDVLKNQVASELVPSGFYLGQNYPNPFKEKTVIKYCLPYKTKLIMTVYNSKGELIDKLIDEEKNAGTYDIEFDACTQHNARNRNLKEGVYHYKIKAGSYEATKEMILQK